MKLVQTLSLIFATILAAGCATQPSSPKGERPPKHAKRVRLVIYEAAPRAASANVDIVRKGQTAERPGRTIALVTCEGTPREEAEMTEAIIYRARLIGANAVVILPPSTSGWGDRRVFRADAVVYETPEK